MWRGNHRDPHREAGREEIVQGPHGGILPGFIRIKAKDDLLDVALEYPRMVGREGGALGRNDILHACHESGDEIELPFADHRVPGVEYRALGLVETEEHLA